MTVLVPGGFLAGNMNQLLFKLSGANLQTAGDQMFTRVFAGANYVVSAVTVRQRSGAASILTAGGVYDQPNKGGNALVAGGQIWSGLGVNLVVTVSLTNLLQSALLANTPYLNLTTTSLTACLSDFLIWGYDLT